MSARRDALALFLIALFVRALAAWPQSGPGYMDAAYYTLGAQRLAGGHGFSERVLWNYLDAPTGLPHPSHLYWMPLPSVLGAAAMAVFGNSYRAQQVVFVVLAALLPPLTYAWSRGLGGSRRNGFTAAGLALFSGYYVIFWGVPESFAPFALCGAMALGAGGLALRDPLPPPDGGGRTVAGRRLGWFALAGVCAALGHLARADGLLLLATVLLLAVLEGAARGWRGGLRGAGLLLLSYGLVMAPWLWRNLLVTGQPLPAAGTATLWLRSYDELFSYGELPSAAAYLAWGWENIVRSKLDALGLNVLNFVAVNNLLFLTPFTLIGLRRPWRHPLVKPVWVYGLLLYATMTLAFTFPGPRGALLHSSAALLPACFAVAVIGMDDAVAWVARRRRSWQAAQAQAVFAAGSVCLAALLSVWLYQIRVLGPGGLADPAWNHTFDIYRRAGDYLREQGVGAAVVMVGEPPGFTYTTGYDSVVVPNEPLHALLAVAQRYCARYVLLDQNRPVPLADVYSAGSDPAGLREVLRFEDATGAGVRLWEVTLPCHVPASP